MVPAKPDMGEIRVRYVSQEPVGLMDSPSFRFVDDLPAICVGCGSPATVMVPKYGLYLNVELFFSLPFCASCLEGNSERGRRANKGCLRLLIGIAVLCSLFW